MTTFTLNGIQYRTNDKGNYYYKSTGNVDKKGNPVFMRIAKHVFEEAFEEYTSTANMDDWDIADEIEDRKQKEIEDAKQVEEEFNSKKAKPEVDHYTVRTFYAGMTGYIIEKNGVEVYNGFSVDEIIEQFGFNPNEVTEIDIPRKKKQPKAKKPRRSKDIAHESNGITLTSKQVDFIKHVPDTCFYENGLESTVWCDVLTDEIGGQFAGKPMTVGAMISTLREKNVIYVGVQRTNGKKAKYFGFTEIGQKIARNLGLN